MLEIDVDTEVGGARSVHEGKYTRSKIAVLSCDGEIDL